LQYVLASELPSDERLNMTNLDAAKNRELVSDLADGRLRGDEFARAVGLLAHDGGARAAWHSYHVAGDVLRFGEQGSGADDLGFVQRFHARLQKEAGFSMATDHTSVGIEIAPDLVADPACLTGISGTFPSKKASANASEFRWKLMAGLASVVAVVAMAWNSIGSLGGNSANAPQLAQVTLPAPGPAAVSVAEAGAVNSAPVMIRDAHLDALMAAHKQFGGTSALQMPAGFLRNATFEGQAR
jgi:sigma-E factor negative regulatory protein RseA